MLYPSSILLFTHPHLVNAAYRVCGGQGAATESGGCRWLGDLSVTLYPDTPHSQGGHLGPLFIHRLPVMPLQWSEYAEMTSTIGAEPGIFRMTLTPPQCQDKTFRLWLRVSVSVASALGQHPWIRENCVRLRRRLSIRKSAAAPVPTSR